MQPEEGRYLIHKGEKLKIEKINISGLITRLYLQNRKKPILFKPNEMVQIGQLYNKLESFLGAIAAQQGQNPEGV